MVEGGRGGSTTRDAAVRPFIGGGRRGSLRTRVVVVVVSLLVGSVAYTWALGERRIGSDGLSPTAQGSVEGRGLDSPRQVLATEMAIPYSDLPAYAHVAWADELEREEQSGLVDGTIRGRYRNVRGGERVTVRPDCPGCPTVALWVSGGSAAFGVGQRDQHTVASELVRLAAQRDGIALDVRNVSREGYTFQMELEWVLRPMFETEQLPQMLVFFHGWNDAAAQLVADHLYGLDADRAMPVMVPSDIGKLNADSERFMESDIGRDSGEAAARRYLQTKRTMGELASETGIRTAYFFQPDALVSTTQVASYEPITGFTPEEMLGSPIAESLDAMTAALDGEVVNLRPAFGELDQPVFLGLVHQNESGARVAAELIYESIRADIQDLARSTR